MQPRHHSRNPDRTSPGDGNRSLCESRTTYDEALGPYTHSGIGHRRYAAAGAATPRYISAFYLGVILPRLTGKLGGGVEAGHGTGSTPWCPYGWLGVVAACWLQELNLPVGQLSSTSDFRALSGDSLVALKICTRLWRHQQQCTASGVFGELMGAFSPVHLLAMPVLSEYAAPCPTAGGSCRDETLPCAHRRRRSRRTAPLRSRSCS